ncbi:hypothetical protein ACIPW5_10920 [Streptomyces sp. NPDC090077]|uniref:hypothetical protein n=1 Tax=Streptomyces sp. NPDC090077 TaxID=3365938 RepID=UPI00381FF778
MNAEVIAAVAAVGAATVTCLGVPATYIQARAARRAADNAVAAARISAQALHSEARRTAQRDAYISLLVAVNDFRDAAWRRSLAPSISNVSIEEASDAMADAHSALRKAIAVVSLDAHETVFTAAKLMGEYAEVLFYSCQTAEGEDDDESIWHVPGPQGDEQVSSDRVEALFEESHQAFVEAVRGYLNADVR